MTTLTQNEIVRCKEWLERAPLFPRDTIKSFIIGTPYSLNNFYEKIMRMNLNKTNTPVATVTCKAIPMTGYATLEAQMFQMAQPQNPISFTTSIGGYVKPKENTMNNMEQRQRSQMQDRLYSIREDKVKELHREFGLIDDEAPKDAEEIIQRIKDGKYVLREKDSPCFGRSYDRIRWRDPAKVEDRTGFELANKRLRDAFETVNDKSMFLAIEDAYVAFEEFKKEDFRNAG